MCLSRKSNTLIAVQSRLAIWGTRALWLLLFTDLLHPSMTVTTGDCNTVTVFYCCNSQQVIAGIIRNKDSKAKVEHNVSFLDFFYNLSIKHYLHVRKKSARSKHAQIHESTCNSWRNNCFLPIGTFPIYI